MLAASPAAQAADVLYASGAPDQFGPQSVYTITHAGERFVADRLILGADVDVVCE